VRPSNGGGDEHQGFDSRDAAGAGVVVIVSGVAAVGAAQTGSASPYLTFAAAIIVALLTWFATDRRQARQLADGRERLRDQLDAEKKRQATEHAHDRGLHDLDHLREFLDEATDAFEQALDLTVQHRAVMGGWASSKETLAELDAEMYPAYAKTHTLVRKFDLRLPIGHEVTAAYSRAADALQEAVRITQSMEGRPNPDQEAALALKQTDAMGYLAGFTEAAVKLVGAHVPDQPTRTPAPGTVTELGRPSS
jgi:hypothetical protein